MTRASMLMFVLLVLCLRVDGGRMKRTPGSGQVAKLFEDKTNAICGGGTIRDLLTRNPSVSKIRNMPWDVILKTADDYMATQKVTLEQLAIDKKRLESLKQAYDQSQEVNDLTDDEIVDLITEALAEGGFVNADYAVKVECISGRVPDTNVMIPAGTYKTTRKAFQSKAMEFFQENDVRANAEHVKEKCDAILPGDDEGEDSSNCDELCNAFADICADYGSNVMKAEGSNLAADLEKLEKKITYEEKEMVECQDAKAYLKKFREELDELKTEISTENSGRIAAREQFQMCQMELHMLEGVLASRQPEKETSIALSAEMGDQVQSMSSALKDIESSSASLQHDLETTKQDIEDAKLALKKASAQFEAIETMKDIVSTLMLQMSVLADEAVQSPLVAAGFDIDMDPDMHFTYDLSLDDSSSNLHSLDDLDELCKVRAEPVFKEVLNVVDLRPLCDVGVVNQRKKEITDAVKARLDAVKSGLQTVIAVMNTHAVENQMSKDELARRTKDGEPTGIYAVEGVYGQTNFFDYLTRWKSDTGDILALYKELGQTIDALNSKTEQLEQNKLAVAKKGDEVLAQMVVAKDQLAQAVLKKQSQDEAHAAMTAELDNMNSNIDAYKDKLAALKEAMEQAEQRWKDAKTALAEAHREGTNLMERYAAKHERGFAVGSTGKIHSARRSHRLH